MPTDEVEANSSFQNYNKRMAAKQQSMDYEESVEEEKQEA